MKFKTFIGVDVSKLTLDVCLVREGRQVAHTVVSNDTKSLSSFFRKIKNTQELSSLLICAEHTGHYSNILRTYCLEHNISLWLESGAQINLSSGVQRSKSDRTDAHRIACYASRYSDRARVETIEPTALEEAKLLLSERELYVRERAKYRAQIKDLRKFISRPFYRDRKLRMDRHIKRLGKSIDQIDHRIDELFGSTEELTRQMEILQSVDGVGKQVALNTIIATHGFRKFKNGRQFACHSGVAPFKYTSGTSQRSRNKVSNRANKKLKTLFHMAALSAIRVNGEFKDYFERKIAEGKNKMTVINAVRAKIINRIFALIRENRTYEKKVKPKLHNP
ncbi:IS110 family transposase [Hyunsoonleella sp. SJ7]|uniref:IS110 family transposase n=1 Tax=Hyunsoonleella aquatilis TaxID=2762758 RepID=A0A923HAY8_9FLAO|nr:IS110 family transposase [Hyunsoonleella aquatilis]MBC3757691.1 IS110 family transposase [Hyunsoonleella aquatilis]